MNRLDNLEAFGTTLNDLCDDLPKGRGRCFDIGSWGGCGVECPALLDHECIEPEETIMRASQDELKELIEEGVYVDICKKYISNDKIIITPTKKKQTTT